MIFALGHHVAMSDQSVRFITVADMMLELIAAHRQKELKGYLS